MCNATVVAEEDFDPSRHVVQSQSHATAQQLSPVLPEKQSPPVAQSARSSSTATAQFDPLSTNDLAALRAVVASRMIAYGKELERSAPPNPFVVDFETKMLAALKMAAETLAALPIAQEENQ